MKYVYDNDKYSNSYCSYGLCSSLGSFFKFKSTDIFGNCKTKIYPDGSTNSIVCRSAVFKNPDLERTKLHTTFESFSDISIFYTLEKGTSFPISRKPETDEELSSIDFSSVRISSSCTLPYDDRYSDCEELVDILKNETNEKIRIRHDSVKRAKDSIFDYAFCNKFDYFFTGTINPKKLDSKSPAQLLQPVQNWLKNYRRRYGIEYIMVAEYHKKGGIHFHGLINFGNLTLLDSGTKSYDGFKKPMKDYKAKRKGFNPEKDGKIVYNVPNWRFGFTTCIKTYGDSLALSRYISKYLTKDCSKIFGKFFWHSRGLKKPDILVDTVDYDSVSAKEFFNCYKYVFLRGDENNQVLLEIVKKEDEIVFDGNFCCSSLTGEIYFECSSSPPDYDEYITIFDWVSVFDDWITIF